MFACVWQLLIRYYVLCTVVATMAFPEYSFPENTTAHTSPPVNTTTRITDTYTAACHAPAASMSACGYSSCTQQPRPLQCTYTGTHSKPSSCIPVRDLNLPAIFLCPQCPKGTEWKKRPLFEAVMALLDKILHTHPEQREQMASAYRHPPDSCNFDHHHTPFRSFGIDVSRVYVTGMSMGGLGAWMFAARYPGKAFSTQSHIHSIANHASSVYV